MRNVYLCHTYYHLLISVIKAVNTKGINDVILFSDCENGILIDKNLIENVKKSNVFNSVLVIDNRNKENKLNSNILYKFKKFLYTFNYLENNNLALSNYDNTYIYNDTTIIGRALNFKKIKYHLLEDGTDCFKNNKSLIKGTNVLKNFVKKYILFLPNMGQSKYIIDIEVNDKNNLNIKSKKVIENNKSKMLSCIDDETKSKLLFIFLGDFDINQYNGKSLIITQPLYEDGLLDSELEKVSLYRNIIDSNGYEAEFIIKPHPRENTNYKKYFKNCTILTGRYPLEIVDYFKDLNFDKIITVSSTSINSINNCNKKITLGWDYLNEYKKEYCEKGEK